MSGRYGARPLAFDGDTPENRIAERDADSKRRIQESGFAQQQRIRDAENAKAVRMAGAAKARKQRMEGKDGGPGSGPRPKGHTKATVETKGTWKSGKNEGKPIMHSPKFMQERASGKQYGTSKFTTPEKRAEYRRDQRAHWRWLRWALPSGRRTVG
jgi:hypothetical protein